MEVKPLLLIFFTLISLKAYSRLEITGNKRTQDKFIKFIFNRCLKERGEAPKKELANKLSQCMMNERIFHDVTVRETKDGWDLKVKERWTLIPIPRFDADTQGNKYYGLGVADTNLFGRRIFAYAEYLTGTVNQFSFFYLDPSFLLTNNVFRFRMGLDNNDIVQAYKAEAINGFTEKKAGFNIGYGHDFGKPILSALFEYVNRSYAQLYDYELPEDYDKYYLSIHFLYDDRDFKLSYNEGLLILIKLAIELYRTDSAPSANILSGIAAYIRPGFWDHNLKLTGHFAMTTTDDERDALKKGRSRGFRGTLRYSIWAESYVGAIIGYDVPLIKWNFGTWVVSAFSDLTYINNVNNLPPTKFYSGGVGTYFYLKKLAIPGIGIEYGWQNQSKTSFWAFNVGFDL